MFVADTCIGGLSVVRHLWESGRASNAIFLADYSVNPLGVKHDSAIAEVVDRWLSRAAAFSDTLVIACNTLSIRYHQLRPVSARFPSPASVISMVDCFQAMVEAEAERLADRKVLIVGTQFTASQGVYAEILNRIVPGSCVDAVAATELERKIARLQAWHGQKDASLTPGLRSAIGAADVVVLACTCFPMVLVDLQAIFPDVVFIDPGAYCPGLGQDVGHGQGRNLSMVVTGDAVAAEHVIEYAASYLGAGLDVSITSQRSE